jgi:hypothetical protein
MDLAALQANLLAQRLKIMEELGMLEAPAAVPVPRRASTRIRTRSSEKSRRAAVRAASAAAKALATSKTRKQLRGNAKLLAEAGVLPNRLKIGTPLARIEGTGYHHQNLARRRSRR